MTMVTVTCPKCGADCLTSELVCANCGTLLFDPSTSTVHMRVDPSLLRLRRSVPTTPSDIHPDRTVILLIRGMKERLSFEEGTEILLGRTDVNNASNTRLDLTNYGAHERGVSREHAVLRFVDGKITVTDLGSVNGTTINFQKLLPNQPHELHHGDELTLGRLSIICQFEVEYERRDLPDGDESTMKMTKRMANSMPAVEDDPTLNMDARSASES